MLCIHLLPICAQMSVVCFYMRVCSNWSFALYTFNCEDAQNVILMSCQLFMVHQTVVKLYIVALCHGQLIYLYSF